jgi:hypothetical protein
MNCKCKKSALSIILYAGAVILFGIGIAVIVLNVKEYKTAVVQYVAQGYTAAEVSKALIQSQLIPAVLQAVGTYMGIGLVLVAAGAINCKVSKCIMLSAKDECCNNDEVKEEVKEAEVVETPEEPETVVESQKEESDEENK